MLAMVEEKWLSTDEAAEILNVHPRTVRRWIHQGKFPGVRRLPGRGGGEYRIPRRDVERILGGEDGEG